MQFIRCDIRLLNFGIFSVYCFHFSLKNLTPEIVFWSEILILTEIFIMKVYKFGGASVKDAEGIRNLAKIVSAAADKLVIVVSAFGKTTNALEKVLKEWLDDESNYNLLLDEIYNEHIAIIGSFWTRF